MTKLVGGIVDLLLILKRMNGCKIIEEWRKKLRGRMVSYKFY
jgi:hypothetical protein